MKSLFYTLLTFVAAVSIFAVLAACGDEESVAEASEMPIAKTRTELPKCNASREGQVRPVEEDEVSFRCENGEWIYHVASDKRRDRGSAYDPATGTLTDLRDNQTYRTVKIGDQVWMAENLRFRQYVRTELTPCYEDKEENCDKYGRLYSVNISTQCPKGWHLPDSTEFRALFNIAEEKQRPFLKALAATDGWDDYNGRSMNGTDDLGFSLLPGGYMCKDSTGVAQYKEIGVGTMLDSGELGFFSDGLTMFVVVARYGSADMVIQDSGCYAYVRCVMD